MAASQVIFIIGIILSSTGLIGSIGILIFNLKFMKLRFVKMTSPKVNLLLVLGAAALYITTSLLVLPGDFWSLSTQTIIIQTRTWLFAFGFTITYGSMLFKGWRVHRLFQYSKTHSATIKDMSLFGGILFLILLDGCLLTCWTTIDPLRCNFTLPINALRDNGESELSNGLTCVSNYFSVWIILLLMYKYIITIVCCYIGWKIRHITFPALDDSRCLLVGSGICLVLSGIFSFTAVLFPYDIVVLNALMAFSVWAGTTVILVTVFLPKMAAIYKSHGSEPLSCSASKYMQQPVSDDLGSELIKILGENRHLKQMLEERESLLRHLKRHASSSINTDCDSQQMSSTTNYSVASAAATNLLTKKIATCLCLKHCLFGESDDSSIQAKPGTPVSVCKVLSSEYDSPKNSHYESHDGYSISKSKGYTLNPYPRPSVIIPTLHDCVELRKANLEIVVEDYGEACQNEISIKPEHSTRQPTFNQNYCNELQLICSIADAYDLGDDDDTLSFISSCIYHNDISKRIGTRSLHRHNHVNRLNEYKSLTLGNDQLYPAYQNALKPQTDSKRQARRHSYITPTGIQQQV